jgi:hypothetical protein
MDTKYCIPSRMNCISELKLHAPKCAYSLSFHSRYVQVYVQDCRSDLLLSLPAHGSHVVACCSDWLRVKHRPWPHWLSASFFVWRCAHTITCLPTMEREREMVNGGSKCAPTGRPTRHLQTATDAGGLTRVRTCIRIMTGTRRRTRLVP